MPFAGEIFFDAAADLRIRNLWDALEEVQDPSRMKAGGYRPSNGSRTARWRLAWRLRKFPRPCGFRERAAAFDGPSPKIGLVEFPTHREVVVFPVRNA